MHAMQREWGIIVFRASLGVLGASRLSERRTPCHLLDGPSSSRYRTRDIKFRARKPSLYAPQAPRAVNNTWKPCSIRAGPYKRKVEHCPAMYLQMPSERGKERSRKKKSQSSHSPPCADAVIGTDIKLVNRAKIHRDQPIGISLSRGCGVGRFQRTNIRVGTVRVLVSYHNLLPGTSLPVISTSAGRASGSADVS